MYHTIIVSVIQYSKFVTKKPHYGTKLFQMSYYEIKMYVYIYKCFSVMIYIIRIMYSTENHCLKYNLCVYKLIKIKLLI